MSRVQVDVLSLAHQTVKGRPLRVWPGDLAKASIIGLLLGGLFLVSCHFGAPASSSVPTTPTAVTRLNPRFEVIASELDVPWALDFAPDGRIFVTERPGRIRVIANGRLQPNAWATLPVAERAGDESGLMGLAIDPAFQTSHAIYVYYTYAKNGELLNRLVRMVEVGGKGEVDRIVLDAIPGARIHDGGRLRFGPDGKLYLTIGDAGVGISAQAVSSVNGKILRLNSDGTIPADNPFPGSPVFSYGHRNVQGLAWQPGTNRLYVSEHGPSGDAPFCCHDKINLIEPGVNYGWPLVYGQAHLPLFRDPIVESGLTTWAPAGTTFGIQGPLRDALLVAMLSAKQVRVLWLTRSAIPTLGRQETLFNRQFGRLRDVVLAPDGSFYLLTSNRDGRGQPAVGDDRVIHFWIES